MAQSGGDVAARPAARSNAVEDRLSALPDDLLVIILLRLDNTAEATRTSVLSRRWRYIWPLLPELCFPVAPSGYHIREVLAVSDAPALRRILVAAKDDASGSVAAWLPLAARRLSGELLYSNTVVAEQEEEEGLTIPLPCFGNATSMNLDLGFLRLAVPSTGHGAFARLTELCLKRVRFQGVCDLGDLVSSPRCPGLRVLRISHTRGLARLDVHSESLLEMDLWYLDGLQKLNIDASALKKLKLLNCFGQNQPVADISAPQMVCLQWRDCYDPRSVKLGRSKQLRGLCAFFFWVYGQHGNIINRDFLRLLQQFQVIPVLSFCLGYPQEIGNLQYLMDEITSLPHITYLSMYVMNNGHSFGASSFHMLRLCTSIRRLLLTLRPQRGLQAQPVCQSGCICDQPSDWNTEELKLNYLKEVEITGLNGADHEVAFLKRLLNWAAVLEKIRITLDYSISKSKVRELCETLSNFCGPEIHMEFYKYQDEDRMSSCLLSPEDEGT